MIRILFLFGLMALMTNCATLDTSSTLADSIKYHPETNDDDERHHKSLVYKKRFKEKVDNKDLPDNVKIYYKKIPEGFDYKWTKSTTVFNTSLNTSKTLNLHVKKGYRHKLISKVDLRPRNGKWVNYAIFMLGTNWNYVDGWRKAICYPQIPLYYLSLGYWGILPTWYPCVGNEETTRKGIMKDLKLAVEAAGGDFAVAVFDLKRSQDIADLDKEPQVNNVQMLIYKVDPRYKNKKMKLTPLQFDKSEEKNTDDEERDL